MNQTRHTQHQCARPMSPPEQRSLDQFLCGSQSLHLIITTDTEPSEHWITAWQHSHRNTVDSVIAHPHDLKKPQALIDLLCDHWQLSMPNKTHDFHHALSCCLDQITDQSSDNQQRLLIIDHANELTPSTLSALMFLATYQSHEVIKLLLIGNTRLIDQTNNCLPTPAKRTVLTRDDIHQTITMIQRALLSAPHSTSIQAEKRTQPSLSLINQIHHETKGDYALIEPRIHAWLTGDAITHTLPNAKQTTHHSTRTRHSFWQSRLLQQGLTMALIASVGIGVWNNTPLTSSTIRYPHAHIIELPSPPITPHHQINPTQADTQTPRHYFTISLEQKPTKKALMAYEKQHHINRQRVTIRKTREKLYEIDYGHYPTQVKAAQSLSRLQHPSHSQYAL